MLVDEAEIIIRAGHGGPGRVSFRGKKGGGPDGGVAMNPLNPPAILLPNMPKRVLTERKKIKTKT